MTQGLTDTSEIAISASRCHRGPPLREGGGLSSLNKPGLAACVIVGALPAALVAGALAKSLAAWLIPLPDLSDFRVGNLALQGQDKRGEVLFPLVLFGVLAVAALVAVKLLRSPGSLRFAGDLVLVQALLSLPVVTSIMVGFGGPLIPEVDSAALLVLVAQVAVATSAAVVALRTRRDPHAAPPRPLRMAPLLLAAVSVVSILGGLTALRYVIAPHQLPPLMVIGVLPVVALGLAACIGWNESRKAGLSDAVLYWAFTMAGISALPLLLPPLLRQGSLAVTVVGSDPLHWKLAIGLLGVAILAESTIRWRLRRGRDQMIGVPASLAIAPILVVIRTNFGLPTIPADDYHFGELIAPFFLWSNYGQIPYVELALPRGVLLNVLPGAANALLNDGSAATFQLGATVVATLVIGAAHMMLRPVVGFALATGMVVVVGVANYYFEGDLITVSIALFVMWLIVSRQKALLVGAAVALGVAASILLYPLMGLATGAGVAVVVGMALLGGAVRADRVDLTHAIKVAVSGGIVGLLIVISPLGRVMLSAIMYVVDNAGGNVEAFGMPMNGILQVSFGISHLLSFAFFLAVPVSMGLIYQRRADFKAPSWFSYAAIGVAAFPAVLVVILSGRFLGRLEAADYPFRAAAGTIVVLGLVLPAVLVLLKCGGRGRLVAWASLLVAGLCSAALQPVATLAPTIPSVAIGQGHLLRNALGLMDAPAEWASAPFVGEVPQLGMGQGDVAHLQEIASLERVSRSFPSGEPVLNLSNRGALFALLDWRNPTRYLAPYNTESADADRQMVEQLKGSPPTYAFAAPANPLDGGSLTLRNPELGSWVMDAYRPIACESSIWARRTGAPGPSALSCPTGDPEPQVRGQLWADAIGAPADIGIIPFSWGSRVNENELVAGQQPRRLTVTAEDVEQLGTQSLRLGPSPGSDRYIGDRRRLLLLDVTCPADPQARQPTGTPDSRAYLSWPDTDGSESTAGSAAFAWGAGRFLVPVDAYPTWYLASSDEFTLTTPTAGCPSGWAVEAEWRPRSYSTP